MGRTARTSQSLGAGTGGDGAQVPRFIPPMLASRSGRVDGKGWRFEHKLDGYRLVAVCTPREARLWSRNGIDVTARYPRIARDLPRRPLVLDGEAIAMRDGREDFEEVQQGRATHYVIFDAMHADGEDTMDLPWHERRRIVESLPTGGTIARSAVVAGDPARLLERACHAGWEGLIAKQVDAPYRSGRTAAWRKLKCALAQEFLVVGHVPGTDRQLGALILAYNEGSTLRYAGKVGTGFDRPKQERLLAALAPLRTRQPQVDGGPRDAVWARPQLVAQVAFSQWTRDGRLRHPRFVALRDDKDPRDIVREPGVSLPEVLR